MNLEKNKEKFINKALNVHKGRYDYSKVEYRGSQERVCIICPEHGEFYQTPARHLMGDGCPKCGNAKRGKRLSEKEFIKRANEVHNNRYKYIEGTYTKSNIKVPIICPEHGEFWQTPAAHLNGEGCPKCCGRQLNTEDVTKLFRQVHGDRYDYSKVVFSKMDEKVCIICPVHGEFYQTPAKHIKGQGCPKCSREKNSKEHTLTTEEFIGKANEVHKNRYSYEKSIYRGSKEDIIITCPKHGDFIEKPNYHLSGHGCPKCGYNVSQCEEEIKEYLNNNNIKYIERDRNILENKELDIFVPEYNVGIEFDGLYWHSELYKESSYHLKKTEECLKKGIRLIHIFEDEWLFKQDIIKSILLNVFNKIENKIYARKCCIKIVNKKEKKIFLNRNHLQGNVGSLVDIGLYYNSELVSLMCFGRERLNLGSKNRKENTWELLRFCNKLNTTVVGGASKLFKYFIDTYNPKEIISYCDRRYGTGNMYEKLGFIYSHSSQPNYFYIEGNNRKNRFKYRKSELIKNGFDSSKSEKEIMKERKIYRIYDCGCLCYIWKSL